MEDGAGWILTICLGLADLGELPGAGFHKPAALRLDAVGVVVPEFGPVRDHNVAAWRGNTGSGVEKFSEFVYVRENAG